MVKPIDTSTAEKQWSITAQEKQDITIQNLDSHIDINSADNFIIISSKSFGTRLWYVISNPFCYLFNGYVRY